MGNIDNCNNNNRLYLCKIAKSGGVIVEIDVKKVISHLEELYQCGAQEDGTYTRMAYSEEDIKGRQLFANYFKELGMEVRTDKAGNMIARLEGTDSSLPAIMMGSHLDTVPDGGKYDGVLGCVAGLAICETLIQSGQKLNHPVEVVVFTDEEGFRFGSGMLGSCAMCGKELEVSENDLDMYGVTRSQVMKSYDIEVSELSKAARGKESVHCFLELHVEQGASLYKSNTPIGIVSSIAGVSRHEIVVTGKANHAGSTRMTDRKDALVAAAQLIANVPEMVKRLGNEFTVATVGTIKVTPNSVNVIPESCTFHLEIRDQYATIIQSIEEKIKGEMEEICKEGDMSCSFKQISYHDPEPMTGWVTSLIEKAVKELAIEYEVIPSGAFHDSLIMASVFPTGMIFVPSVEGISHSREELTHTEDIKRGLEVLLKTVLEADNMNISC